jgi:hypothetical protein
MGGEVMDRGLIGSGAGEFAVLTGWGGGSGFSSPFGGDATGIIGCDDSVAKVLTELQAL